MIAVQDISVEYAGGVTALRNVTLEFRKREFTVLLGLSGAGKSTLLRTFNLLTRPTRGKILVDGIGELCPGRLLRNHRRHTAMVFQQHQLIARQNTLENVLLGRIGAHGWGRTLFPFPHADRILALQCLERVGLLDKALERVGNLSGGQQQRVGIARALAQKPGLLLADEPVASLDPSTGDQVMSLIRDIAREDSIPVIVSLHQIELARRFADRVIGLSGGAVVFDGPCGDLSDQVLDRIYRTPHERTTAKKAEIPRPFSHASEKIQIELETIL